MCALAFINEAGDETTVEGTVEGRIGHELRGSEGFGYDPMFMPEEFGFERSLAEVSQDEKNAISHRGNALRILRGLRFASKLGFAIEPETAAAMRRQAGVQRYT